MCDSSGSTAYVDDQYLEIQNKLMGAITLVANDSDLTEHSTTSTGWTTVKTFTISNTDARRVNNIYYKVNLKASQLNNPGNYSNVRLVSGDDIRGPMELVSDMAYSTSYETLYMYDHPWSTMGMNGDIVVHAQIRSHDSSTTIYIDDQYLQVEYNEGLTSVFYH
jgi:hypothetical protein